MDGLSSQLGRPARFLADMGPWSARLAAFCFGVLYVGGMAPFHFWGLSLLALTGLVWLMDGVAGRERPVRRAMGLGWWFGFGQFLAGTYWVGSAFIERGTGYVWMAPFGVALMAAGLALFWMGGAALAMRFWSATPWRVWVLALCLFLMEWLRAHVLSGFPWNLPGMVWVPGAAVSQSAALIGVSGLGLLTLMAFTAPAALVHSGNGVRALHRILPLGLSVLVFGSLLVWGQWRLDHARDVPVSDARIRVVQAEIDQRTKWRPENQLAILDKYLDLSAGPGMDKVEYVVWPEGALPMLMLEEPEVLDRIARRIGNHAGLITGLTRRVYGENGAVDFYNSLGVFAFPDGKPRLELLYDKHHLTPFGEYLPFGKALARTGISALTQLGEGFTPGPGPITAHVPGVPPFSPQICYEIIFPNTALTGKKRPDWIVNVTNDSWFGHSSGPYQHAEQAQWRAIEAGLPVVRSASSGISGLVDPWGRMIVRMGRSTNAHEDVMLPRALNATFYSKTPWVVLVLWGCFCFAVARVSRVR